ncbi:MAG: hypothetical protein NVV72_11550 [Asticcacaulis sp.]|nr:hypothetical protein [Asticcacaulis sp.]
MDWTAAIEMQHEALKRIVAALAAMAGLTANPHPEVRADPEPVEGGPRRTLPRHLHRAILRLLRPAESAARRLAIALARRLPAPPAVRRHPAGPAKSIQSGAREASSIFVRHGAGTGIVLEARRAGPGPSRPSGSRQSARRPLAFPLLDPLPRWRVRPRWQPAAGVPRIGMAGLGERIAIPARRPPLPDDPLDAGRLGRRLDALSRARWTICRGSPAASSAGRRGATGRLPPARIHRVAPLRGGRPPGGRLARYDPDAPRRKNIRDVDEVLAHAHALARHALRPDTS